MKTGQINLKQFLIGLEVTPSYEGLLKAGHGYDDQLQQQLQSQ